MFEHMNSLSNVMVVQDCMHLLETAAESESASKGYAGCLGYCMSGPFAFTAAAIINQRIRAAASIHGVRLFTDSEESPHLNAHQVKGELYFGCAETDEWAPRELINNLENHLSRTGVHYRIESGIQILNTDLSFRNVKANTIKMLQNGIGTGFSHSSKGTLNKDQTLSPLTKIIMEEFLLFSFTF